jgi:hypothetical protein
MYIIANIAGGLGNQMFQYAAAYSLAQNKNFKLMLGHLKIFYFQIII